MLMASTPNPNMTITSTFRISQSPLQCLRSRPALVARCPLLRSENRITLHVNPIRSPRGDVAPQAILLLVCCNLLVGSVGGVQSPAPAIPPQWIVGIAAFLVLDHHEPDLGSRSPMCVPCGHRTMVRTENFFYQYGSISEFARLAVILSGARRSVGVMHLCITLWIEHRKSSERLISIPVVWWLPNVPSLIHKAKTSASVVAL